jgi:hypothetical protein
MEVEMAEVPAAVEPLSFVLTFPLDVARGVLPIEGEVECVRRERVRLPTYRRERNKIKKGGKKKRSQHKLLR